MPLLLLLLRALSPAIAMVVMAQLESQSQSRGSQSSLDQAKSLISALGLVSRNLPLSGDLLDAVASLYYEEDGFDDAEDSSEESGLVCLVLGLWGFAFDFLVSVRWIGGFEEFWWIRGFSRFGLCV